jgi:hypothetical protein
MTISDQLSAIQSQMAELLAKFEEENEMKGPKIPILTEAQKAIVFGDPLLQSNNPVFFPGRLISLWDMSQMVTERTLNAWVFFGREFQKSALRKKDTSAVLLPDERKKLIRALEALHWQCELTGMTNAMRLCKDYLTEYTDVAWHWDADRWEALEHGVRQKRAAKRSSAGRLLYLLGDGCTGKAHHQLPHWQTELRQHRGICQRPFLAGQWPSPDNERCVPPLSPQVIIWVVAPPVRSRSHRSTHNPFHAKR